MPRPWVFIDVSYLAYRALHSTGDLEFETTPTGVIFGLFNQLKQICQDPKINSNRVGLFFDSRHSFRAQGFHDYKKKRRDDRSEEEKAAIQILWQQVNLMEKEVFPEVGIPCYRQVGLESDDLLAMAAKRVRREGERAILVTADGDLFQSISDNVDWFDPGRGVYYTRDTFEEAKGIEAKKWGLVKAYAGCHSDNVPGIPGIGEKTAIKAILGILPTSHKTFQKLISEEGRKIIERNKALVVLPHARTIEVKLKEPTYNAEAFFKICRKYGLKSFLKQKNSWTNFFRRGGTGSLLRRRGESRG